MPPQEILTKDSVTVNVDAVVYYNIHDTLASVINVEDADKSTKQISATTLRSILGTHTLQEILSDREKIGEAIYEQVKMATDAWGVQVHTCKGVSIALAILLDYLQPMITIHVNPSIPSTKPL